jgi:hypothetical protein
MSYYQTLVQEITDKIETYMARKQILNADWITTEICNDHEDGLAGNEHSEFWQHGGARTVREQVRKTINKMHGNSASADDRQGSLPGFLHLQNYYMVIRDGDEVGVPLFDMSDAEIDIKAEQHRAMGRACYEHADELERFKHWRKSAA